MDLSEVSPRRELFQKLGREAKKALVICEGLLVYLEPQQAESLAADLASIPAFENWVVDLASPALLRMLQKNAGKELARGNATMKFGPEKGAEHFVEFGWRPVQVQSMLHSASRLKRLPWGMRVFALFPPPVGPPGSRPWSGVCLLRRG